MISKHFVPLALVAALTACGSSQTDRALTGGGLGAAAGAAGAALTGGDVLTGAIIGGVVGAGTGILTDQRDLDLGTPVFRR